MSNQPTIFVACALIESGGHVLAARRGPSMKHAGYWEFPGGKLESGETPEQAVIREIDEELGVTIKVIAPLSSLEKEIDHKTIRLLPFRCQIISGVPQAVEHSELCWVEKTQAHELDWLAGDREILAQWLQTDSKASLL